MKIGPVLTRVVGGIVQTMLLPVGLVTTAASGKAAQDQADDHEADAQGLEGVASQQYRKVVSEHGIGRSGKGDHVVPQQNPAVL